LTLIAQVLQLLFPLTVPAQGRPSGMQARKAIMNSDKACYWLAAAVLALGLSGSYQGGRAEWAHHVVNSSQQLLSSLRGNAAQYLAVAHIMLGRESVSAQTPMTLARASRTLVVAPFTTPPDLQAVAFGRLEQAQLRAVATQLRTRLACQRVRQVRVELPMAGAAVEVSSPRVHVEIPQVADVAVDAASAR
jgi:type IV secretory pathway VirB2 component (pilin)